MRKYAVEAIGTFFLVLAAIGGGAIAAGLTLAAMVFAGGHISGGHYNPAVSLAAFIRGRFEKSELLPYFASQFAAAVVAGLVGMWFFDPSNGGVFEAEQSMQAMLAEFVFTFALAWVVLNVATSKSHPSNDFYAIAIGATVAGGATAVGSISGGAFNPAVALGVIVSGGIAWANIWVYLVACFAGGAAAGVAFKALNPDDV